MKTTAFKNTDIGPIPEDWEVKRIEDFYEVGSSKRVFQSQWRTSGIPFYRARDIVGFRNGEKAVGGLFIDASLYEHYKRNFGIPAPGDLLVTAVGTLGKVFRVVDEAPFYFKDGNIIWFRANGQYDSCLLEQLFESGWLDSQINDTAGGSTVGTYTITNAKKTLLPLPPLPEQRRIAAALSDADELVASLNKLIEKKKRVKEGAMQRLLSGETRLPGFGGKKFKQTDLGSIPDDWELKKLGEILKIGNGKDYKHLPEGDVPVYGTGGLMTYVNEFLHEGETVCIGRKGTIDEPQYHEGRIWTVDTLFYTYDFNGIVPKFLFYLSKRIDWQSYNTATGVPSLTAVAIQGIPVKVPPLSEQRAIAAVLSDMDAEIAALSRERAEAARIKQGMMQELLTGKTRLAEGE